VKPRDKWRPVLDAEMKRWSAMSCSQLLSRLAAEEENYDVEFESQKFQVEVKLLEDTAAYIHVAVAVDDGHFWRALRPLSRSFICRKESGFKERGDDV
jgi:hypothetical protein